MHTMMLANTINRMPTPVHPMATVSSLKHGISVPWLTGTLTLCFSQILFGSSTCVSLYLTYVDVCSSSWMGPGERCKMEFLLTVQYSLCHVKPVHCWGSPSSPSLHNLHLKEYFHGHHYLLTPLQTEAVAWLITECWETVLLCLF